MIVEFTRSFDKGFSRLPGDLQLKSKETIQNFIDCYADRHFPKGLRAHRCGPFLSLSMTMNHRILVLPIEGGIKFVFIGDHKDAENYLKRG